MKNSADQGGCYPQRPKTPNSIIALSFIQNISPFLHNFLHFALGFPLTKNNTISYPGFLGQWFNNLQQAALLTSLVQYDKDSFQIWSTVAAVMVNYACRFNQSETGKYFE